MHTCIVVHNIHDLTWIVGNSWKFTWWFHQKNDQHIHVFVFLTRLMHNIIIIKIENGGESYFLKTKTNYCNYSTLTCLTSVHCLHNILQNEWGNYHGKPIHGCFHQIMRDSWKKNLGHNISTNCLKYLMPILRYHAYSRVNNDNLMHLVIMFGIAE